MPDRDGSHSRRQHSASESHSEDNIDRTRRPDRNDRRERYRSRSRDRPLKRRSLSPDRRDHGRRSSPSTRDERRQDRDSDRRKHPRRRSLANSRSPPRNRRSPEPFQRAKGPLPSQQDAFKGDDLGVVQAETQTEKQKPNFGTTGRLAAASNTIQTAGQTVILKYHEPAEGRKPSAQDQWRMYVFKGDEIVETIELAQQSCWLFGREAAVVDALLEHSSCSKQHAVVQFRYLEKRNEFGDKKGRVRPYVLDLESANGTSVNGDLIPGAKYVELRDKDVVKFGRSSREYVLQLPPPG